MKKMSNTNVKVKFTNNVTEKQRCWRCKKKKPQRSIDVFKMNRCFHLAATNGSCSVLYRINYSLLITKMFISFYKQISNWKAEIFVVVVSSGKCAFLIEMSIWNVSETFRFPFTLWFPFASCESLSGCQHGLLHVGTQIQVNTTDVMIVTNQLSLNCDSQKSRFLITTNPKCYYYYYYF